MSNVIWQLFKALILTPRGIDNMVTATHKLFYQVDNMDIPFAYQGYISPCPGREGLLTIQHSIDKHTSIKTVMTLMLGAYVGVLLPSMCTPVPRFVLYSLIKILRLIPW